MGEQKHNLYVIAGCNGAGKTTASFTVLPEMLDCREFVLSLIHICVAITTGGSPRGESFAYLERLGHRIETPVPSLFTFNIASPALRGLMGTVVDPAVVGIPGTDVYKRQGIYPAPSDAEKQSHRKKR